MSFQRPTQIPTEYTVSIPNTFTALAPPSFHGLPGSSIPTDRRPEGPSTVGHYPHHRISRDACWLCRRQLITFNILPDDVLLEIFDFYVHEYVHEEISKESIEEWIRLTHVCRRWRTVVFQSPLRLGLQLVCTPLTPTRDMLDIWPPLPLMIRDSDSFNHVRPFIEDNIIAALEHNDRVREIQLFVGRELGYFTNLAALKPFPELTDLWLRCYGQRESEPILPDSFLGGSAPRLRSLHLEYLSFPGLPKLLLSATHLVDLDLSFIPRSGYIPPEVMATSLSALTSLESLSLRFDYPPPRSALETRHPPSPPLTRSMLLSLTRIEFKGTSEYSEVILARIDTPRLNSLQLTFFNQLIFDTPQLFQFISRRPTLRAPEEGYIIFGFWTTSFRFPSQTSAFDGFNSPSVKILCMASEWQLSSLEQVCNSFLPTVPTLKDLYISEYRYDKPVWQDDVENTLWLDLLRSFVAVKNLYISEEFVPRVAPALQELVGGRTTEVLPALENIFLEGPGFQPSRPLQEGIEKFVAARSLTSRPVAVSRWDRAPNLPVELGPEGFDDL